MGVTLHSDKGFAARLIAALSSSSVRIAIMDKSIAVRLAASSLAGFKIVKPIVAISSLKKVVSITEIVREPTDCGLPRLA